MTAALRAINDRWIIIGHPHANGPEEGQYSTYCPRCQTTVEEGHETLHSAMNTALTHKMYCTAV